MALQFSYHVSSVYSLFGSVARTDVMACSRVDCHVLFVKVTTKVINWQWRHN